MTVHLSFAEAVLATMADVVLRLGYTEAELSLGEGEDIGENRKDKFSPHPTPCR